MSDCIFCKIIAGEIPCHKIYENENVLAFLDIQPFNKGHVLIIPKKHFAKLHLTDDEYLADIFKVAKKIAIAQMKAFETDRYNLLVYGEDVSHFHVHVYPRFEDDGITLWEHKKYETGELEDLGQLIKENL